MSLSAFPFARLSDLCRRLALAALALGLVGPAGAQDQSVVLGRDFRDLLGQPFGNYATVQAVRDQLTVEAQEFAPSIVSCGDLVDHADMGAIAKDRIPMTRVVLGRFAVDCWAMGKLQTQLRPILATAAEGLTEDMIWPIVLALRYSPQTRRAAPGWVGHVPGNKMELVCYPDLTCQFGRRGHDSAGQELVFDLIARDRSFTYVRCLQLQAWGPVQYSGFALAGGAGRWRVVAVYPGD